jgi:hypothetical protein
MIYELTTQEEADAIEGPKHVWLDVGVYRVYTGEDMPAPTIPQRITKRQGKLALHRAGLLAKVNAAFAAMPGDAGIEAGIEWADANDFERHSPMVESMRQLLDLTPAQVDQLFVVGASL